MATSTTNLGLFKPELTDPASIDALNQNWDKIDERLGDLSTDAIIEKNKGNDQKFWVGTKEEFKKIKTKDPTTQYTVTDEDDYDIPAAEWQLDETTKCFYRYMNGEKEWMNPPLTELYEYDATSPTGEYRTTERYFGMPVYTCIINTGAGVSGSSTEKSSNVQFISDPKIIRSNGFALHKTTGEGRAIPYVEMISDTSRTYWSVTAERVNGTTMKIIERSHTSRADWTVYFQMWYIKGIPVG